MDPEKQVQNQANAEAGQDQVQLPASFCPYCGEPTVSTGPGALPYCKGCRRYIHPLRKRSSSDVPDLHLSGIRGWLILPAIGAVLNPILLLSVLITDISTRGDYEIAFRTYPVLQTLFRVEILGAVIGLLIAVPLLFLFFGKHRLAPPVFIWSSVIAIVFDVTTTMMVLSHSAEFPGLAAEFLPSTIGRTIAGLIWIGYFRASKRVKATFVN